MVALTVPEVGVTTISEVPPNSGNKVASTLEAPKSWWKSSDTEPSLRPPIRSRKVLPKAVVSCSSAVMSSVTAASELEKSVESIVIL